MDTIFIRSLRSTRPTRRTHRQNTDWSRLSNNDLKFALDLLSSHHSPEEVNAAHEISKRIDAGIWLDIDQPIPATEELPAWLKVFPFCLLWKQRPRS